MKDSRSIKQITIENENSSQYPLADIISAKHHASVAEHEIYDNKNPLGIIERDLAEAAKENFEYPVNPAFVNGIKYTKKKKLEDFMTYCRKKNVPFS